MRFAKSNNQPGEYPTYYYRLIVENEGGVRAEDVEVFLSEKYVNNNGYFEKDTNFLPLNLVWSHTRETTKKSIAPSLFKYCDFGHINHPNYSQIEGGSPNKVLLFFDFEVLPNTKSYILEPGIYRFKIIVTADNADSITKIYQIKFKDKWDENEKEMLANNFLVTEIDS
jgi:hypothetical protein